MREKILILLTSVLSLAACSGNQEDAAATTELPTDTIPVMVMQIQKCSRLYTSEYRIHKIITHEDQMQLNGSIMKKEFSINLPVGNRRIAIPMDAVLKAYIDFDGFSEKNIRRDGNRLVVTLPDPKIALTSTKINHKEVKQYVALTRSDFSDKELTGYEQQGRRAIIASIPKMGIIENARASAARTLIPLFAAMGYQEEDITVNFRKDFTLSDLNSLLTNETLKD